MATSILPQDTEWHTVGKGDKHVVKTEIHSSNRSIAAENPYSEISSPSRRTMSETPPVTKTSTKTKTTTTYPSGSSGLSSYFGPSSTFRRNQQKWLLGASVLGLSLLVALTAISLSHTIGSTKSAIEFAKDKAQQLSSQGMADDAWEGAQRQHLHPSQMDNIGDTAAHLKDQAESWMDHSKHTGKTWWSTWSHWLSGELEHAEQMVGRGKDQAQEKIAEGNMKAQKKLLEPEHEGMFMRAYHYLFSGSEADEAAARAREYANEARDAIKPTVWERMKHAIGQSTPEESAKFFAESGIDNAGNIIDKSKFDAWEQAINVKDRIKDKTQEATKETTEPSLSERVAHAFHHEPTEEDLKEQVQQKMEEYYDQARTAAHPTLWARFKNAFGTATPVERAQIFASAGLDDSGRIVDKVKFAAYEKALYTKDRAKIYADEAKTKLHPTMWARLKHAFGQASPTEIAQIYATAGLDQAGNIIDKSRFNAWEQAQKLKAATLDAAKTTSFRPPFWLNAMWDRAMGKADDLQLRAQEAVRPPTMWERVSSSFHHEPTWTDRSHQAKQTLDEYYDAARNAAHPTLWTRFKSAFGASTPAERAQMYAAAGLDEAGNIIDRVKFAAYEQALKAKDAVSLYADNTRSALHPSAWARLKHAFGQSTPTEQAQIYADAGLDEAGNIIDKTKFAAWDQALKLRGAAYDAAGSIKQAIAPKPSLYDQIRYLFVSPPTTTQRAQDLAARGLYATRDAAQQAYEAARDALSSHEPTIGERISGLFRHKPTAAERAKIYAEQLVQTVQHTGAAAKERLYPEPTLGQQIRHLFVRDNTPAERLRYLASAGLDEAGNIVDKAKFSAWEQALKIKAAAHDATHPSVWERTKAVFIEPTPAQKAKLYAGQLMDASGNAYDALKHTYEPSTYEKVKGYFVQEDTTMEKARHATERATDYVRSALVTPEPTFGERISSAFSGSDLTTSQRVADSLHGTAAGLRHEPTLTERVKNVVYGTPEPTLTQRVKEGIADVIEGAGQRLHHEPTMAERAQAAAQKIRDSVVGAQAEPSTYDKIKDAILPHHEHLKQEEKDKLRAKAHEAIDKSVK